MHRGLWWLGLGVLGCAEPVDDPGPHSDLPGDTDTDVGADTEPEVVLDDPPDQAELVRIERTIVDETRVSPALGSAPEEPSRTIDLIAWIGASPGAEASGRPLVLMGHGNDGDPTKFEALASTLAAEGVVVVAVRFPRTHLGSGSGFAGASDVAQQPGDLAFVLDHVLQARQDPSDPLFNRFDDDRVVALGHSLGGATVLAWTRTGAGAPGVAATILVAPFQPILEILEIEPEPAGPPTLVVQGADDTTVQPPDTRALVAFLDAPVWSVELTGVTHSEMLEDQAEPAIPARDAMQRLAVAFAVQATGGPAGLGAVLDDLEDGGHAVTRRASGSP